MRRFLILLAALVAAASFTLAAQAEDSALSASANAAFLAANAKKKGVIVKPDGLQFRILQNGFGVHPGPTDTVTVYYTGMLINGTVFDGTSPGLPATLKVNSVIPGWIEALETMRVGDHWQVFIPSSLGYGERVSPDGSIPPGQTLIFDLQLMDTTPAAKKGQPGYVPDDNDKDDDKTQ